MSSATLARRRARLTERIAEGRMDIMDSLDVVLGPLRRIDRLRMTLGRIWGGAREAGPMFYPLAPVGALVMVRGRRRVGAMLVGVLRLMLKTTALTRVVRQVAPLVEAVSRGARRQAARH
ncbi:MAG TPA: hypothetical protein VL424_05365 [Pararobbsia sp.]|jgi:hypothetical protein|nr:hypothetical protein [Pararobbsia sp.]